MFITVSFYTFSVCKSAGNLNVIILYGSATYIDGKIIQFHTSFIITSPKEKFIRMV